MEKRFLEPYYNKPVAIGVPHNSRPRPFFYYGKLIEITDSFIILQFKSGVKQIQIADIVDIHLENTVSRG